MNNELENIQIALQEAQLKLMLTYLKKMIFELNNQDTMTSERVMAYKKAGEKINQELFIISNLTNVQSRGQRIDSLFKDFILRDVL